MSKKKRNRRPNPPAGPRPSNPPAGSSVVELEAVAGEADDSVRTDDDAPQSGGFEDAVPEMADATDRDADAVVENQSAPVSAPAAATAAGWIPHESGDIRGVLIQIAGGRLLLPNATIAEVLSYAEPESAGASAEWLLGRMRWRGWQLPLIAFSRLAGIGEENPGLGSKVIVLKALGGDRRIPYFAILTQGFPRLVTVARGALEIESGEEPLPVAIQARVRLNDEPALLPDLLQIEQFLQAEREAA